MRRGKIERGFSSDAFRGAENLESSWSFLCFRVWLRARKFSAWTNDLNKKRIFNENFKTGKNGGDLVDGFFNVQYTQCGPG